MFNLFKNTEKIRNTVKDILMGKLGNLMYITYKKTSIPKKIKTGYDIDIETVARRYSSIKNYNLGSLLDDHAVKDNLFFLEEDCKKIDIQIARSTKLLDVGCGNGMYNKVLKINGGRFEKIQYYGCEIDDRLVRVCKKLNQTVTFFVSHAENIDSKDNFYDFVFCSGILHYSLGNWKKAVLEMKRVSKKYLIITRMPLSKYEKTFYVSQEVFGIYGKETHYFVVPNRKDFEQFLIENGLKIMNRDYTSEEYNITGVGEKIMLSEYLLVK